MNILITGATGFVGGALTRRLVEDEHCVRAAVRAGIRDLPAQVSVISAELKPEMDWRPGLRKIDTVVHLAARAHIMKEAALNPLAEYRRVNVAGTLKLARQAAEAGVRRFVFLSSIKVNGESTAEDCRFTALDQPAPSDPYGISKFEAEEALWGISGETKMGVVIIRPPLVYGPGVKANFLSLLRWLNRGVPLPLASVCNKRSLIALDNLVDLIVTCMEHPAAANQTFLASDGEDISTPDLLRRLGRELGHPARLIPVPVPLLDITAILLGKRAVTHRLCHSLRVDISKARDLLNWTPAISVDEGLQLTARWFLRQGKS